MATTLQASTATVALPDGSNVFYRHMGQSSQTPFLLLHGYPSSSFQFRNLIPLLSEHYHVVAPDLPGFGFTQVAKGYTFNFDSLSRTIESFIDALGLQGPMPVYIFDYGAPTAMRIFERRPDLFSTIITQNGNAYEEGLGAAWDDFGIRSYWRDPSSENRTALRSLLTVETTKLQYTIGHPNPEQIPPETYMLDYFISNQNIEAMLDLFGDYMTNVQSYPRFSQALQSQKPRVLAVWGKHDPFFIPPGARAWEADVGRERFREVLLDAGHFALESHLDEIASEILAFLRVAP